jgi:hypothetical protein
MQTNQGRCAALALLILGGSGAMDAPGRGVPERAAAARDQQPAGPDLDAAIAAECSDGYARVSGNP